MKGFNIRASLAGTDAERANDCGQDQPVTPGFTGRDAAHGRDNSLELQFPKRIWMRSLSAHIQRISSKSDRIEEEAGGGRWFSAVGA